MNKIQIGIQDKNDNEICVGDKVKYKSCVYEVMPLKKGSHWSICTDCNQEISPLVLDSYKDKEIINI